MRVNELFSYGLEHGGLNDQVQHLADTIHDRLPETIAPLPPECSVSIGTSINLDTDTSLDCLIARADEALYAAKNGRA